MERTLNSKSKNLLTIKETKGSTYWLYSATNTSEKTEWFCEEEETVLRLWFFHVPILKSIIEDDPLKFAYECESVSKCVIIAEMLQRKPKESLLALNAKWVRIYVAIKCALPEETVPLHGRDCNTHIKHHSHLPLRQTRSGTRKTPLLICATTWHGSGHTATTGKVITRLLLNPTTCTKWTFDINVID